MNNPIKKNKKTYHCFQKILRSTTVFNIKEYFLDTKLSY